MEKASKSLWSALRRVARPEKPIDLLVAVWPVVLGPRMAAHTRPVAWNKGTVTVDAPEPEWRAQLEHMSDEIRKRINRWWGAELVREVRLARSQQSKEMLFGRRSSSGSKSVPTVATALAAGERAQAESKLQSALKELEPALRGIADEDLRDLISRVASKYLAGRETPRPAKEKK